jgi:hypothetical protein
MVEVDKEEMVGSDMMVDGVPPPRQFRHYICWMLPCSGNNGDKLVTKSPKKTQLDYKSKQDKMSEIMSRLKLAGKGVGTLQNGYLRKVPLPRVPQIQRASPTAVAATLIVNPPDTGYLPDPRIPLYNNLSRLLLAVGKRCLPMRLVG